MITLGFDTSNYTTSVALYDSKANKIIQSKQILSVPKGQKGLRQSEALFQHTLNLPNTIRSVFQGVPHIDAVAASEFPRLVDNSYMPCFLAGKSAAISAAYSSGAKYYSTSHQHGHIVAALFGSGNMHLLQEEFYALHLSGGTTEILHCKPSKENILDINLLSSSLDINSGQIVDRTGVLLNLQFPCGKELDKLANLSQKSFHIRPTIKNGNCCLSGVENQVINLLKNENSYEDIANFAISSVIAAVDGMLSYIFKNNKALPVVFSGGVSSNSMLQSYFSKKYNASFAKSEYSCDNAAGVALIAYLKNNHGNFNS